MKSQSSHRMLDRLRSRGLDIDQPAPGRIESQCPSHNPHGNLELAILKDPRGDLEIRCHRGCTRIEVLEALGLTEADLHLPAKGSGESAGPWSTLGRIRRFFGALRGGGAK